MAGSAVVTATKGKGKTHFLDGYDHPYTACGKDLGPTAVYGISERWNHTPNVCGSCLRFDETNWPLEPRENGAATYLPKEKASTVLYDF